MWFKKEKVIHNWEFQFKRMDENHEYEIYTYQCKDCKKLESKKFDENFFENVDKAYDEVKDRHAQRSLIV